jgi:hypothetical protein
MRKFFLAIVNAGRNLPQNPLALEGGQSAGGPKSLDRRGNCDFGVHAVPTVHMRDESAIVRRVHVDDVTLFQPLPVHKKTVGGNRSRRRLNHAYASFENLRSSFDDYRTSQEAENYKVSGVRC